MRTKQRAKKGNRPPGNEGRSRGNEDLRALFYPFGSGVLPQAQSSPIADERPLPHASPCIHQPFLIAQISIKETSQADISPKKPSPSPFPASQPVLIGFGLRPPQPHPSPPFSLTAHCSRGLLPNILPHRPNSSSAFHPYSHSPSISRSLKDFEQQMQSVRRYARERHHACCWCQH